MFHALLISTGTLCEVSELRPTQLSANILCNCTVVHPVDENDIQCFRCHSEMQRCLLTIIINKISYWHIEHDYNRNVCKVTCLETYYLRCMQVELSAYGHWGLEWKCLSSESFPYQKCKTLFRHWNVLFIQYSTVQGFDLKKDNVE